MSPTLRVLADKGIKLHEWQERIVRAFESGAPVVVLPGWRRPNCRRAHPSGSQRSATTVRRGSAVGDFLRRTPNCGTADESELRQHQTTMEPPQEPNTQRTAVAHQRLVRRLEQRDRKIAGLERKIKRLEEALTWRTIDIESLSRNVRREVQDALCNVRMIPVFGGTRDRVITEVRNTPANSESSVTNQP